MACFDCKENVYSIFKVYVCTCVYIYTHVDTQVYRYTYLEKIIQNGSSWW